MYEFYENIKLISTGGCESEMRKLVFTLKMLKKHTIKITQIKNLF